MTSFIQQLTNIVIVLISQYAYTVNDLNDSTINLFSACSDIINHVTSTRITNDIGFKYNIVYYAFGLLKYNTYVTKLNTIL